MLDPAPEALQLPLNLFRGLRYGQVCVFPLSSEVRIQIPRRLIRAGGLGGRKQIYRLPRLFSVGVNGSLLMKSVNVNFKQSVWMS